MKRLNIFLLFLLLFPSLVWAGAGRTGSGYAVVIDQRSYSEARAEVDAYVAAVEKQGLKTSLIIDRWQHPDSIRKVLHQLYLSRTCPLEGAVLIGDIPVPMLRDAQHLSTAFKMDQDKYAWNRSSVPSDRFYDDFDLQFTYLKQDTLHRLYHYYSMNPGSPQHLTPDIYTGRIKPPAGKDQYEKLKAYLKKVVEYRQHPEVADQVLYFTGHGYNSESPHSWMDEKLALFQQFAYMNRQQNYLEYINFKDEEHIKFRLMAELKRKDLDIALLHHHGGPRAQYLDGTPETSSVQGSIDNIKFYLRSKLRDAGNSPEKISETKKKYMEWLGVTDSWFDGTFEKEQIKKDSLYNANLDINLEDHEGYSANVRFIMLDACFTGSFHLDQYLSGEYIFDEGRTIVVQANSVNVFQDKWADEMVGLLGLGLRTGFWHKMNCSLETHLIGDPAFAFSRPEGCDDLNKLISSGKDDPALWKKMLQSPFTDVRCLALRMLFVQKGKAFSDELLDQFKTSGFYPVRAEAFKLLSQCRDKNFIEAINLGINDSYELIQRLSALEMGNTGDISHIPYLIGSLLRNNLSPRVEYNLRNDVSVFSQKLMLDELAQQLPGKEYILDQKAKKEELERLIHYNCGKSMKSVDEILSDKTTSKDKLFNIRAFRNTNVHPYLADLIRFTSSTPDEGLKIAAVEMLGWFNASSKRQLILDFCREELSRKDLTEPYRSELTRTMNRVK
ncbi:MAG: HEAT repeat domain-containing protein [Mangrovibacterium sp.]